MAGPKAYWKLAEDDESSDCPDANGQYKRKTTRMVQGAKSKRRRGGDGVRADPLVLSLLERDAVQPGTVLIYKSHVLALLKLAEENGCPLLPEATQLMVPMKANQFDDAVLWNLPYLKFMDGSRHYRTCVSLLAECILDLVKPPAPPPQAWGPPVAPGTSRTSSADGAGSLWHFDGAVSAPRSSN